MSEVTAALFVVEGEMTIYNAAETKAQLQPVLLQNAHLEIDLSKVTEIDTSGLQLLIMAKRSCEKRAGKLRLHGASTAVSNIFHNCGLTEFFAAETLAAA